MKRNIELARQRITSMSDEELRNEIKRLAGLETKDLAAHTAPLVDAAGDAASAEESVSCAGSPSTETATGAGLADVAVHGRTGRRQDESGG